MARFNLSEQRALSRGETIRRDARNKETGGTYNVDVRQSWDHLYYRHPDSEGDWYRTPKEARLAHEVTARR